MQMSLHHESITDALREVVQAAGGAKKVGGLMFPDMPIDHAASRVRDCLNTDRRERFTSEQVLMLIRLGRQAGCHAVMTFMAHDAGYADPQPVEPEDEVARLQREFVEASKALMSMATKIESIQARSSIRSVA